MTETREAPPEPPAPARDDDVLEDSEEIRSALGAALQDELSGGEGVRYAVCGVIALVVAGFVAMVYATWQVIGR